MSPAPEPAQTAGNALPSASGDGGSDYSDQPEPTRPAEGESVPVSGTDTAQRPVLVVDFGAQYAQLIARRVREASVYSEIVPHTVTAADVARKNPLGIVLSGGPASVYDEGAPPFDAGIFDLGVPVLGICYGFQVMATALGGEVEHTGQREYGSTPVTVSDGVNALLAGQP
ncbi:MAG: synthase (glutamine-hydrolyzing), partial [Cryobacterium sp.]|nr:synthase (glutamine-hydrolyzing) [Cryobacterium sp.]